MMRANSIKWGVATGIALLGAGSGIVALLEYFRPAESVAGCAIAGQVFDSDTGEPLAGVNIGFDTYRENSKEGRSVERSVAVSGPNGAFSGDCAGIAENALPLRIVLWHPNWEATRLSDERIELGATREDIKLPIRMSTIELKHPRRPVPTALEPGPVGKVVRIETVHGAVSYDFAAAEQQSGPAGGDVYFSSSYPGFWANNRNQRGLVDLGDLGDVPLNQIEPPERGYLKHDIDAVVGHYYSAHAKEGREGDHIIFRLLDIGLTSDGSDFYDHTARTAYYVIQYQYLDG